MGSGSRERKLLPGSVTGNSPTTIAAPGDFSRLQECPLPGAHDLCDVSLRANDIVHDDNAPIKAHIMRKAFRGSAFLYPLRLATGETLMAHPLLRYCTIAPLPCAG